MKKNKQILIFCLILVAGVILLSACGSGNNLPQAANPDSVENPSNQNQQPAQGNNQPSEPQEQMDPEELQEAIQVSWNDSPHAAAFVVDDANQNNSCAKCHSPINWQPTLDDLPEGCFSCKFELSDPEPYIPEQDWLDIPCRVCHEVGKKDKVDPEFKWLEIAQLDEYSSVGSATELCRKCHLTDGFSGHGGIGELGVHQDMLCTTCHDSHSTQAGCMDGGCHEDALESASHAYSEEHKNVACVACHDASGMTLGYREEDNVFSTQAVVSTEEGESSFFFSSHDLQLNSTCDQCHFTGNPWSLSEVTNP